MPHYYLAPCLGAGTRFDPFRPAGSDQPGWAAVDLRPDPAVTAGWWLLSLPTRVDPPGALYCGDDLDADSVATRNGINSHLGITLDTASRRLRRIIPDLLVAHARTDGTRWRPLRPAGAQLEIWLGELIWSQAVAQGGATISDDFNRANSTAMGAGWTEVEGDYDILSNAARAVGGPSERYLRTTGDLAGANHYAQALVTVKSVDGTGTCVRSNAGTGWGGTNCYLGYEHSPPTPATKIDRVDLGGYTTIGSLNESAAVPWTIRTEANGSTIRVLRDGVLKVSVTDTNITTGTRSGLYSWDNSTFDDFLAEDLAAVARPPVRNIHAHAVQHAAIW